MGAHLSKGGVSVEGKAAADSAAAKANGQENGHVKTNGDVSAKTDGEVAAADGNGTAEPAKEGETGAGDAIEPAPATEGEAAKTEGEAAKDVKKKKFSLKNSFKFKGISLKKGKKGSEEAKEEAASPTAEDKPEENGHAAKETKEETPAAEPKEGEASAATPEGGESKAPEEAPPAVAPPTEEAAAPAEGTTPAASEGETKAE
ncbi:MARCKS-related protein 1-A [Thalassophryne amazonica]|uniref:MARCKS-related protein 1-A n=1 Tax=Thalassophryne amazonica TaxID=390379 RepID=UPI001470B9A8|nr:MARCKS-related protein 1-A [Thalassophryne amazonica]